LLVFVYLVQNLSPWQQEAVDQYIEEFNISTGAEFEEFIKDSISAGIIFDYLDIKNVLVLIDFASISFISLFTAFHIFIDKLFFKKPYEEPSLNTALRRSIWIPMLVLIFNLIRLVNGINYLTLIVTAFLIGVVVYVEYSYYRANKLSKMLQQSFESEQDKENKTIEIGDKRPDTRN
jgi:hypothetical protein